MIYLAHISDNVKYDIDTAFVNRKTLLKHDNLSYIHISNNEILGLGIHQCKCGGISVFQIPSTRVLAIRVFRNSSPSNDFCSFSVGNLDP